MTVVNSANTNSSFAGVKERLEGKMMSGRRISKASVLASPSLFPHNLRPPVNFGKWGKIILSALSVRSFRCKRKEKAVQTIDPGQDNLLTRFRYVTHFVTQNKALNITIFTISLLCIQQVAKYLSSLPSPYICIKILVITRYLKSSSKT